MAQAVAVGVVLAAGGLCAAWLLLRPVGTGGKLGAGFAYDVSSLRNVDPALVAWRESATIETHLAEPRGLAVGGDGRIYVAGDRAVQLLDAAGRSIGRWDLATEPRCLAVDGAAVYVGLTDRVEVYDLGGARQATWPALGDRAVVTSIAVSPDAVYVADAGNRVVLRMARSGRALGELGRADPARGIDGLVVPSPHLDVAPGADGLIRVTNPGRWRVEMYTPAGRGAPGELTWGSQSMDRIEGFCGCCNPTDIAVLPDGRIVTSEKGIPRVKVYDAQGRLLSVVAPPAAFDPDVKGLDLAVDAAGRVLVLDPLRRQVRVFVPKEDR